jgi:hypothetical protein
MDHLELRTFSTTLTEISEAMWTAPGWLRGDVGDPRVDEAIARFGSRWSDGRIQVQENCRLVGDLADRAAAMMGPGGPAAC